MKASLVPDRDASAPQVGADLALARERLGATLLEMSHLLRIRLPYLEALEQGRIGALPGRAYALAFLRTYATALGLDADEALRRFKAEAAEICNRTELDFPAPLPERGLPTGALLLLGIVLAVGAYAGWYRLSGEGRLPAETVQPVPAR
ncbi:MAG: helix-turn-helix domain-containing protein, partial [Acetobacteraceae bacterium]